MAERRRIFHAATRVETAASAAIALVTIDNGEDYTKPTTLGRVAFESLAGAGPSSRDGDWAGAGAHRQAVRLLRPAPTSTSSRGIDSPEQARAGEPRGARALRAHPRAPFPTVAADQRRRPRRRARARAALRRPARSRPRSATSAPPRCSSGSSRLGRHAAGAAADRRRTRQSQFIVANPLRQNRLLTAPEAFELGFADRAARAGRVRRRVARRSLSSSRARRRRRDRRRTVGAREVCARRARSVDDAVHGAAPAPYRALDLIEGAATLDASTRATGRGGGDRRTAPRPAGAGVGVRVRPSSSGASKSRPDSRTPSRGRSSKVGIVGAGLMATPARTRSSCGGSRCRSCCATSTQAQRRRALDDDPPRAESARREAATRQGALPRVDRRPAHRLRAASPAATSCSRRCSRSST